MEILAPLLAVFGFVVTPNGTVDRLAAHAKPPAAVSAKSRTHSAYSSNPEYDVFVNGRYVGSDPDPRVRYELSREAIGPHGDHDHWRDR